MFAASPNSISLFTCLPNSKSSGRTPTRYVSPNMALVNPAPARTMFAVVFTTPASSSAANSLAFFSSMPAANIAGKIFSDTLLAASIVSFAIS